MMAGERMTAGPLDGMRVVEVASIGPGPFAGTLLADMGADVVRVDRLGPASPQARRNLLGRGRRSLMADLKHPGGAEVTRRLIDRADVVIEGFRPGVMERLGLGPDACLQRNPALVYGRMTGYGQTGPLRDAAGHDINYIALGGPLGRIGRRGQPPTPPLNLVGDFGGGGMLLAFGVVCALLVARRTGHGQVVDAAMVDGSALLMLPFFAGRSAGDGGAFMSTERGTNLLDSGAPFYDAYETADGRWVSVGAIEPQFYAQLLQGLGLRVEDLPPQMERDGWPETKARFAEIFRQRTRDEWAKQFAGTDACVAPVLDLDEIELDAHNAARDTFVTADGIVQPAPAPRLSVTPGSLRRSPPVAGEHTAEILAEWLGMDGPDIDELLAAGAIATGEG
jgi:alpha-methylacyl-CoA racemase